MNSINNNHNQLQRRRLLLDTNVWVGMVSKEDSLHARSLDFAQSIRPEDTLLLPDCIVEEVASVLTYRYSKQKANEWLAYTLKNNATMLVPTNITSLVKFFIQSSISMSFTDHALVYIAEHHKAELITFDEQLLKVYKKST
jgi:predicted nucleic acid-binding protein